MLHVFIELKIVKLGKALYIPLLDILVPLKMLTMTLSQWCYIIPYPVVVGAGPVTEGE